MFLLEFKVNGEEVSLNCNPDEPLINILRNHLHLTGTKEGCSKGHCGTCTVLLNGHPVKSCIVKASRAVKADVLTIEGLASNEGLHPIQLAFIEAGAVQCGFCTPGMIMRTKALLDQTPNPSKYEILAGLRDNLCRCTGYVKIIKAVRLAQELLADQSKCNDRYLVTNKSLTGIGNSLFPLDVEKKVTGRAKFSADMVNDESLIVKVLRSPHVHARIQNVRIQHAKGLPGVVAVLTSQDIPGNNFINYLGPEKLDRPALANDKVRYLGEPIAIVAAVSEDVAVRAVKLIQVDYKALDSISDPLEALKPESPKVHQAGNIVPCHRMHISKGDIETGFQQAEVIIERTFTTSFNEHAYLEPEAAVAVVNDGTITIYCCTQTPWEIRHEVAELLSLQKENVRVIQMSTGGGFGGKIDSSYQVLVALAAWKTGQICRLVYSREESMQASYKRHPAYMKYKVGATKEGRLVALSAELIGDSGAYAFRSPVILQTDLIHASGPYSIPNVEVSEKMVYTNNSVTGPMRGYGVPMTSFAIESCLDLIAKELNIDPLKLRKINILRTSSTIITGEEAINPDGLARTVAAILPFYEQAMLKKSLGHEKVRKGVGIATVWFGIGMVGTKSPGFADITLNQNGRITLKCGSSDMGQGCSTILPQIASETLGIPISSIDLVSVDTHEIPEGLCTSGSRQTYFTGNAVKTAAEKLLNAVKQVLPEDKQQLRTVQAWKKAYERLLRHGSATCYSAVFDTGERLEKRKNQSFAVYAYATHLAEVEVDENSGKIRVLRLTCAHDVGKAINPKMVEGQIEGGAVMGLGFALMEEFIQGQTQDLRSYKIPTINDTPEIESIIIESEESTGPYGAKGVGEIPLVAAGAAIANAVANALGTEILSLPIKLAKRKIN